MLSAVAARAAIAGPAVPMPPCGSRELRSGRGHHPLSSGYSPGGTRRWRGGVRARIRGQDCFVSGLLFVSGMSLFTVNCVGQYCGCAVADYHRVSGVSPASRRRTDLIAVYPLRAFDVSYFQRFLYVWKLKPNCALISERRDRPWYRSTVSDCIAYGQYHYGSSGLFSVFLSPPSRLRARLLQQSQAPNKRDGLGHYRMALAGGSSLDCTAVIIVFLLLRGRIVEKRPSYRV